MIIGSYGSAKTNTLLNLISHQLNTDKIYLYAKDPLEVKYQYLINKGESVGLKHGNDSEAFAKYLNDIVYDYGNIDDYKPNKKHKILIVFGGVIAHMLSKKKIVIELFIGGRKLHMSLVFITQSYFVVPNNNRGNPTH